MRHWKTSFVISVITLPFCSCQERHNRFEWEKNGQQTVISLDKKNDSLYTIDLETARNVHNTWELPYPVYRFDHGDVTGDDMPEIAVGVVKPTRFDPHPAKRLFLFRIADGIYIRPLWLGSRVGQPLEDFRIVRSMAPARIRTLEREQSGMFLVAEYRWRGFGLDFERYLKREITRQEAEKVLCRKEAVIDNAD